MNVRAAIERGNQRFAAGDISLQELRVLFTPLLVDGSVGPGSPDQFATELVYLFEDDSIEPRQRRLIAERLANLFIEDLTDTERRNLLRLIVAQDRLCEIVSKLLQGIVSRTSFVVFVGKARLPRTLKEHLLGSTPDELSRICADLRGFRTGSLLRMLGE
jgi:hypothetical protein